MKPKEKIITTVQKRIEFYSDSLAETILAGNYLTKEKLSKVVAVHLQIMLLDNSKAVVNDLEHRKKGLLFQLNNSDSVERQRIQSEISALNIKIREHDAIVHQVTQNIKLTKMTKWMNDKHQDSYHALKNGLNR